MRNHIEIIMKKTDFPDEAREFFLMLYDKLGNDDFQILANLENIYFMNGADGKSSGEVNSLVYNELKSFAAGRALDYRAVQMLFLIMCTKELHVRYRENGLSDEMYYGIVRDLCYKVIECKKYDGIWGSMTFSWFHRHFLLTLYSLGRFQFEEAEFREGSYDFGDVHLKKGDRVINFHIPSSGPMTEELRLESYRRAYEFFKREGDRYVVFVCCSWLIYPENVNIYPEKSNLAGFMSDFDIIASYVHPVLPFPNAWRVFYKDYYGSTSAFPQNTRLEKNIVRWLDAGNKIGDGYGVIVFDGEKIVNKK